MTITSLDFETATHVTRMGEIHDAVAFGSRLVFQFAPRSHSDPLAIKHCGMGILCGVRPQWRQQQDGENMRRVQRVAWTLLQRLYSRSVATPRYRQVGRVWQS